MFDRVIGIIRWWTLPISLLGNIVVLAARKLCDLYDNGLGHRGWIGTFVFFPLRIIVLATRCIVGVYLSMWVCTGVRLLQLATVHLLRSGLLRLTTEHGQQRHLSLSSLAYLVAWE
jgi:hypothetical protein